jgi:hypothetical protein
MMWRILIAAGWLSLGAAPSLASKKLRKLPIALTSRTVTPNTPRITPGSVMSNWHIGDILIRRLQSAVA